MDALTTARRHMVEGVWKRLGLENEELKAVMAAIPRHLFLDSALGSKAYQDISLPIGAEQTISQPSMVAMMSNALAPRKGDKILEIGTGSGYQTAILAHYTPRLYTVERIAALSKRAQGLLEQLGFRNIIYKIGDGSLGWESWAPYDRIIVTAGAPVISDKLKLQLTDGGRMLIPMGGRESQKLLCVDRIGNAFRETDLGECRFVPLLGKEGWEK
ncbi:MAG TPA: protein-L-isoaspartate(D-aspartate) O-methyltransferase [Fibrobacteria bacterium]|nr:protein-L-isoaspartate(D-aspartate) O-methyltransferase [Fibrobacteria bacterium]